MATMQTTFNVPKPRIAHAPRASKVFSYPSAGGFVMKSITRVELDWLGMMLPFETGIHDATDEDNLALRMMQIGGRWWPNERLYQLHRNGNGWLVPYGHHYPPDLDVGYCAEGVLVLSTWADNSPHLEDFPGVPPEKPDTWSKLSLCATMEERCEVLREFGAILYDSVEQAPDLPTSLEEGIERDREYEMLLTNMEDRDYRVQWAEGL